MQHNTELHTQLAAPHLHELVLICALTSSIDTCPYLTMPVHAMSCQNKLEQFHSHVYNNVDSYMCDLMLMRDAELKEQDAFQTTRHKYACCQALTWLQNLLNHKPCSNPGIGNASGVFADPKKITCVA